jgi:predicted DNA-binding transcriptional regulator YafY
LEQATQEFEDDRTVRAEVFSQDEVGQLAHAHRMANSIALSETVPAAEATRQEQQAKAAKSLERDVSQSGMQPFYSTQIAFGKLR